MRRRWLRSVPAAGIPLALLLALAPSATVAASGPTVVSGHKAGPVAVRAGSFGAVASLAVPKGSWWINATANLQATAARHVTCRLVAGTSDQVAVGLAAGGTGSAEAITLNVTNTFTAASSAVLSCTSDGMTSAVQARSITIMATKAGRLVVNDKASGLGSPEVRAVTHDAAFALPDDDNFRIVTSLALPAGSWLVSGSAYVTNTAGTAAYVECSLDTGGRTDAPKTIYVNGASTAAGADSAAIAVEMTRHTTAAGTLYVMCRATAEVAVRYVRLVAVKAGTLTDRAVGSATKVWGTGLPKIYAMHGRETDDWWTIIPNTSTPQTIISLPLPAGKYELSALVTPRLELAPADNIVVTCRLVAGSVVDTKHVALGDADSADVISLAATHAFASSGTVKLQCAASGDLPVYAFYVKLVGVQAGTLTTKSI